MAFCVDAGSRSFSDDGLRLKTSLTEVDTTVKCNALEKSSSCDLDTLLYNDDDPYNRSFTSGLSFSKVQSVSIHILCNV